MSQNLDHGHLLGLPAIHGDFGCPNLTNLRSTSNHGRAVYRSLHMHNNFDSTRNFPWHLLSPYRPRESAIFRLESRLQTPYVAGSSGYIQLEINISIESPVPSSFCWKVLDGQAPGKPGCAMLGLFLGESEPESRVLLMQKPKEIK